jgi:hypothetical protein
MSEGAAAKKRRYWARREAGQCVRCGADADGASLCQTHWQASAKATAPKPVAPVRTGPATIVPVLSSWKITPSRRGPWGEGRVVRL